MRVQDIQVGDTVIFETVPNGSYLSEGTLYRVESVGKRDVYFRNVLKGSGTFDSKTMLTCKGVSFYKATC